MTQQPTKKSLGKILMEQKRAEQIAELPELPEDMPLEQFDPEKWLGDLKDKVDATGYKIAEFESYAEGFEAEAKGLETRTVQPLKAKAKYYRALAERMTAYVKFWKEANGYEKLPGRVFTVISIQNQGSLDVTGEPTLEDVKAHPELFVPTVRYLYDAEAIKEAIRAGAVLSFARVQESSRIKFSSSPEHQKETGK